MSGADDLRTALIDYIGNEITHGEEIPDADTDLLLTGIVDSLGVMRIVEWLEKTCDTKIPPGDVILEHFQTVEAMVAYVETRTAPAG